MAACVLGSEDFGNEDRPASQAPARPEGPGAEPPASMGEPVTPHAGISGEESWRHLSCGIDSLDIAGYVDWGEGWPSLSNKLTDGKQRAQAANTPLFFRDSCCGPCLITFTGKPPMFRYHLQTKEFHLFIGISPKAGNTPNVYLSFNSKALWAWGVEAVVRRAQQLIGEMGGRVREMKPSRVDLCADFLIPGGLPLSMLRELGVPEDVMTCDIMKGAAMETFYVGSPHANIRARIYDKAKEVLHSHKEWFKDIWKVEKLEDIWRVEYQLRREALKTHGLDTLPALLKALGGMWRDLTTNWYSLRLLDNPNTSRRSVHPFWLVVQACAEKFGPVVDVQRKLAPSGNAKASFYVSRAATLLVGYAACVGLPDLTDAAESFMASVVGKWSAEDFFEAYTTKTVQLNPSDQEERGEGGDDDIPF